MINAIDAQPADKGGAYVAATTLQVGRLPPLPLQDHRLRRDLDAITPASTAEHFTRVVREDPGAPGLLYAGTERGIYVSFDDGARWQPFQLNLPIVPVTDLTVKDDDLVAATQGRAFWVLDDLGAAARGHRRTRMPGTASHAASARPGLPLRRRRLRRRASPAAGPRPEPADRRGDPLLPEAGTAGRPGEERQAGDPDPGRQGHPYLPRASPPKARRRPRRPSAGRRSKEEEPAKPPRRQKAKDKDGEAEGHERRGRGQGRAEGARPRRASTASSGT